MPDVVVEPSPTDPTETDAVVAGTVPAEGDTPAEAQNTVTPPAEHMIPKSRLDEVLGKERDATARVAELEAEKQTALDEAEAKATAASGEEQPPDNLDERQRVRWFVEQDSKAMLERELGMDLTSAKAILSGSVNTNRNDAMRLWREHCDVAKLDPENEDVQVMVGGLTKMGVPLKEAFAKVSKMNTAPPAKVEPTATVETAGVTGVQTTSPHYSNSRKEAAAMAAKGERATQLSSQELIEAAVARDKAS